MRWPDGVLSAGEACGIKDSAPDLGVIVLERPCTWAGTFTQNAAAAAPVQWCRDNLGAPVRAVVVNSGNANACTGPAGTTAVGATADTAAALLSCAPEEVLIASTGPIGVALPVERICDALPATVAKAHSDVSDFANAIMTTDTQVKVASADAGPARVVGVAKGAAMIAPNMATMLAFIATDATIPQPLLQASLSESVAVSFNRISVDACESTNDSVFLLSTGSAGPVDPGEFGAALGSVCRELAEAIVADAEGGTRLVRIRVEGAHDESHALELGRAVAASVLWRAAMHGADPNWGRVLAALGTADRGIDIARLDLSVGPVLVFSRGAPTGSLEVAAKAMEEPEFSVTCSLGAGDAAAEVLTTDLSPEYVALNAEGTS
jgi:glutamate N-acetyltransferase/amino-acid N-acetyltransferase